ncbi:MAG: hypothetical protein JW981_09845 [Anaerolineae bacterium]|nr:hypothetical protein [Anaerolineae bacterium]
MISRAIDVIEIRDCELQPQTVIERLQSNLEQRWAGKESVDFVHSGPKALRPGHLMQVEPSIAALNFPGLNEALIDLTLHTQLDEPQFTSTVPVVGKLIVAIRSLWNRVSTKWYVLPMLWQQSDVNTRTATVLSSMAQWQEIQAQHTAALQHKVAKLEARLAKLESEEYR